MKPCEILMPWCRVLLVLLAVQCWSGPAWAEDHDEEAEEAAERRYELLEGLAEAHFEKAEVLSEIGQPDAAVAELRKIRDLDFDDPEEMAERLFEVETFMAEIYLEAERPKDAEALLADLLKSHTGQLRRLAALHVLMARSLREQDRGEEALEHLNLAIEYGQKALEQGEED